MTAGYRFVINPGPVDDIRQDNAHRVGASNHHHNSGSGENPMVDGTPQPSRPADRATLVDQNALLGGVRGQGKSHALVPLVSVLCEENTALRERLEAATAELDAANDAVVELIGQLEEAGVPVTSITVTAGGA